MALSYMVTKVLLIKKLQCVSFSFVYVVKYNVILIEIFNYSKKYILLKILLLFDDSFFKEKYPLIMLQLLKEKLKEKYVV